jgi:hypothetical protein
MQQRKSKEWVWADEGRVELVMKAYDEIKITGSRLDEERTKLINILARNIKPRKDWPKEFSDEKARKLLEFFVKKTEADKLVGGTPVASVRGIGLLGKHIPELRPKAEQAILAYYARDNRAGPRGECLQALAELVSDEGLRLMTKSARSSDTAVARAAIYAMSLLWGTKLDKGAREGLLAAVKNTTPNSSLALKILADKGERRVVPYVAAMLKDDKNPMTVEAGAFAAGKFKLKETRAALQKLMQSGNPYVAQVSAAALQEIDKR